MIKKIIKRIVFLVFFILIAMPLYLIYIFIFFSSRKAFTSISELLSLIPGYCGYFIRQGFYRLTLGIGRNVDIRFGTILEHPTIRINNNVYIGQNCTIGTATIGNGVKLGSNVDIVSGGKTHKIQDGIILPTDYKDLRRIHIGNNTWIGNSSVILNHIGKRCIIGAGSIVVKPIPDNSVAVGNPARVIRKND